MHGGADRRGWARGVAAQVMEVAAATNVLISATPIAAPTCWLTLFIAPAVPASRGVDALLPDRDGHHGGRPDADPLQDQAGQHPLGIRRGRGRLGEQRRARRRTPAVPRSR